MKVFKSILGVHKQATNLGVLLELGRTTLDIECIKFATKNWERIKKGTANNLIIDSYKDASCEGLPWLVGVEGHLERNSLHYLFVNSYPNRYPFIYKKIHETMTNQFHVDALSTISGPDHKLRTYALFKGEVGREKYLSEIGNVGVRTQLTKFRISDHNLMIEKGRHKQIHKDLRFCPFCRDRVEDEIHFLVGCPIYNNLRRPLLDSLFGEGGGLGGEAEMEIFLSLMSGTINQVATFIHRALELRNFLLDKPKRSD